MRESLRIVKKTKAKSKRGKKQRVCEKRKEENPQKEENKM